MADGGTREQQLAAFIEWVAIHREQAGRAHPDFVTYPKEHTEHGWCDGVDVGADGARHATRYWWTDPGAVRFELTPAHGLSIEDLGDCTPIVVGELEQARLQSGPLEGMVARRRRDVDAPLEVMTLGFLRRVRVRQ